VNLKTPKTKSRMVCVTCTLKLESCCVTVATGNTEEVYGVYAVTPGEGYEVKKLESGERYSVNLWNNTCECLGAKNGYLCRHIRMVKKLREVKKLK
jgi:hypothetical protein